MIALTKFFDEQVSGAFKEPMDDLDREFKIHLVFVFNQAIQAIRQGGLSATVLEKIGKMVSRLYGVFRAYKTKKTRYTPLEWVEHLAAISEELKL